MKAYETIFEVAETCQNGNERRKKVSVYSPIFVDNKHIIEIDRINKGIAKLESLHYYDIKYIKTRVTTLILSDAFENILKK